MRIAINTLSVLPNRNGGGEVFIKNLVRHLIANDKINTYVLLVNKRNRSIFGEIEEHVQFAEAHEITSKPHFRILYESVYLPFRLKALDIDVLVGPADTLPLVNFTKTVLVIQNIKYFQKEQEQRPANLLGRIKQIYFGNLTPRSIIAADRVIAVSEETSRNIVSFSDKLEAWESKISIIYEGVHHSFGTGGFPAADGDILCVSSFAKHKNIDKLVHLYMHLKETRHIRNKLRIVGNKDHEEARRLENIIRERNMAEHIIFEGFVPNEELPRYYHQASIFITLSSLESFGLPIVEAMTCGVPVLVNDASVMPEIINGHGILLTDVEDIEKTALQVYELLSDKDKLEHYSKLSLERARDFSWDTAARQYIKVFESLKSSRIQVQAQ
ncbi:glycosyltransferase family 4 protein [Paenibacillus sp. RC84]|uniref:glycosyltransferase family 4 protein n=1 Tax=Paenibacillus sp. RC84 TaxID=3156252 RepID=UPI003517AE19